ncbi:MAG: hypothetical protein ABIP53_09375 [Candidatus Limnocylindrales bacterium]
MSTQFSVTCPLESALAVSPDGAAGALGGVSVVVAVATFELADPPALNARTWYE